MKKTFSLVILVMIIIASLHAQKPDINTFVNFQNLSQIQKMPKPLRDSMIRDIKKMGEVNSSFKRNGKDLTREVSASTKNIYKEMSNLLVQILETPDPALIAKNQIKMDELMNKVDKKMDELDSKLEKKGIKDEYRYSVYNSKLERSDARKDMREKLRELKQERRKEKKEAREDKREVREERRENRKDMREEC